MENKDLISLSGDLDDLCGVWLSMSFCPSLIIYKDHSVYKVAVINIDDAARAIPQICTLRLEEGHYFVDFSGWPVELLYNAENDTLVLPPYGCYLRQYL